MDRADSVMRTRLSCADAGPGPLTSAQGCLGWEMAPGKALRPRADEVTHSRDLGLRRGDRLTRVALALTPPEKAACFH